ncbi:MAG: matrixin family metalloprotease [Phycisphaerales bacterium]|nr:matrixin family metalloprotease [Phycisphaerales bacterium]
MRRVGNRQFGIAGAFAITILIAFTGCDAQLGLPSIGTPVEWVDPADIGPSSRVSGPFGQAIALPITPGVKTSVSGSLNSPDEVATYQIGAIEPGDRITIEVNRVSSGFDPSVAVFDAELNLMHLNDDGYFFGRTTDSFVQVVARHYTSQCFVVVAPSVRSDTVGDYNLHITLDQDNAKPNMHPQIVYLDFDGGSNVVIASRAGVDIPKFSGSLIDDSFADATDELRNFVIDRVRSDYAPYDVTIISSTEEPPPAQQHTTVFFGSYSPTLLGIADSVDTYNDRPVQEAIVFVDTFSIFMSQEPTLEEMGDALANVASHEIGHLLGLHHTKDPLGIMDTSATLRQMLKPQVFTRSPINGDTFHVGYQDAPLTLLDNVGGDELAAFGLEAVRRAKVVDSWYEDGPQTPAREQLSFGSSCTGH